MSQEYVIKEIGARFNQVTGGSPETDVNKRVYAITGGEMNVLDLFRRVFGFRGVPYGIVQKPWQQNKVDVDPTAVQVYSEKESFDFAQKLGTPIFQPVVFTDMGDPITGKKLDRYVLPNEPLVTIDNTKRLIETPSAGGTQDVIEHIALNYYTIKIQGFIVNMETDDYPDEEVRKMRSYYEIPRSFKVENPLLSLFNINQMAMKMISWPAVEGHQAIQGYQITGRSDKPYQLVKKNYSNSIMINTTCEITIGEYVFTEANSVVIRTGRNLLVGNARIVFANIDTTISNPTVLDNAIKVDDPVTIKLGYDGDNKTEFVGFVSEKRPNSPFEIICEDAMRDLRTPFSKNYASVKLADLIRELVPTANIYALPDITLTDFRVNKATKLQVLQQIKSTYPAVDIYFRQGVMYAGFPYLEKGGNRIVYHLQDTVQKHNLVFTREGDLRIRVEAISMQADGSEISIVVGDAGGDSTTLHFNKLPEAQLKQMAEAKLKDLKVRGYKGQATTWGIPFAKHGDIAEWEDRFYPERRQANFIDEVTVEWGATGFKRILKPGQKALNDTAQ